MRYIAYKDIHKKVTFIFATYLLFLSLACSMAVRTWKYIPYTNYLCYIYDSFSFSYRDSYNIKTLHTKIQLSEFMDVEYIL